MKIIYLCIDQLDLAAHQLNESGTTRDRLALILCDNVVELILQDHCKATLHKDSIFQNVGKSKYTRAYREQVLGNSFQEKVKHSKRTGLLDPKEAKFVNNCHYYRNQLYHQGLAFDDIMPSLSWNYREFACNLFGRFEKTSYSYRPGSRIPDTVEKHMPSAISPALGFNKEEAAESIRSMKNGNVCSLRECLSRHAVSMVRDLDEMLDCLVKSELIDFDEKEVILYAQFLNDVKEASDCFPVWLRDKDMLLKCFQEVGNRWRPQFRTNPLPTWLTRAKAIGECSNYIGALNTFQEFIKYTARFKNAIREAFCDLDGYIEHLSEVARGK